MTNRGYRNSSKELESIKIHDKFNLFYRKRETETIEI